MWMDSVPRFRVSHPAGREAPMQDAIPNPSTAVPSNWRRCTRSGSPLSRASRERTVARWSKVSAWDTYCCNTGATCGIALAPGVPSATNVAVLELMASTAAFVATTTVASRAPAFTTSVCVAVNAVCTSPSVGPWKLPRRFTISSKKRYQDGATSPPESTNATRGDGIHDTSDRPLVLPAHATFPVATPAPATAIALQLPASIGKARTRTPETTVAESLPMSVRQREGGCI